MVRQLSPLPLLLLLLVVAAAHFRPSEARGWRAMLGLKPRSPERQFVLENVPGLNAAVVREVTPAELEARRLREEKAAAGRWPAQGNYRDARQAPPGDQVEEAEWDNEIFVYPYEEIADRLRLRLDAPSREAEDPDRNMDAAVELLETLRAEGRRRGEPAGRFDLVGALEQLTALRALAERPGCGLADFYALRGAVLSTGRNVKELRAPGQSLNQAQLVVAHFGAQHAGRCLASYSAQYDAKAANLNVRRAQSVERSLHGFIRAASPSEGGQLLSQIIMEPRAVTLKEVSEILAQWGYRFTGRHFSPPPPLPADSAAGAQFGLFSDCQYYVDTLKDIFLPAWFDLQLNPGAGAELARRPEHQGFLQAWSRFHVCRGLLAYMLQFYGRPSAL